MSGICPNCETGEAKSLVAGLLVGICLQWNVIENLIRDKDMSEVYFPVYEQCILSYFPNSNCIIAVMLVLQVFDSGGCP